MSSPKLHMKYNLIIKDSNTIKKLTIGAYSWENNITKPKTQAIKGPQRNCTDNGYLKTSFNSEQILQKKLKFLSANQWNLANLPQDLHMPIHQLFHFFWPKRLSLKFIRNPHKLAVKMIQNHKKHRVRGDTVKHKAIPIE